jgi:hypothetical protein
VVVSSRPDVPAALSSGKDPQYPLDRRLAGLQSRSGRGGGRERIPVPVESQLSSPQPVHTDKYNQEQY